MIDHGFDLAIRHRGFTVQASVRPAKSCRTGRPDITEVAEWHGQGPVFDLQTEDEVLRRARSRPTIGFEARLVGGGEAVSR